jgi:hypothetical protein
MVIQQTLLIVRESSTVQKDLLATAHVPLVTVIQVVIEAAVIAQIAVVQVVTVALVTVQMLVRQIAVSVMPLLSVKNLSHVTAQALHAVKVAVTAVVIAQMQIVVITVY